jgi:hypothetical protein
VWGSQILLGLVSRGNVNQSAVRYLHAVKSAEPVAANVASEEIRDDQTAPL